MIPALWVSSSLNSDTTGLLGFWERLGGVRALRIVARSARPNGWNRSGSGVVAVESSQPEVLVFRESGLWQSLEGGRIAFRNVFRWRRLDIDTLRLEHLRYGADHPVTLFDLVPGMDGTDGTWTSVEPHQCRDDCYRAGLWLAGSNIVLRWSVTGPRKQQTIESCYSP
jgi:hypothetical protein